MPRSASRAAAAVALVVALLAAAGPAAARVPAGPSAATCRAYSASRTVPAIRALLPARAARRGPRVFALQFKQDARYVRSYATFRTAIECQLRRYVVPDLAPGRPNLVVLNEDIGLMVPGIGSRGKAARTAIGDPSSLAQCRGVALCATLKTLDELRAGYAGPLAFYEQRYGALNPLSSPLLAAADTEVRGFLGTFSSLAKKYGIYMVGSGPVPKFTESRDPATVAALRDPDLRPRPRSVFVASSGSVYNTAFVWGPRDVRSTGPAMLRNVVQRNDKVPLTGLEIAQGFAAGPSSGPAATANLRPYRLPGTKARLGIATSLPAFVFGDPPAGTDPCSDTAQYYMRCLDELGANLVIQDEANPGAWATGADSGEWQPLDWMGSSWRNVGDPSVHFTYNVTAFMTGNLADLTFDGQSSITQRGLRGTGCHYVGNAAAQAGDLVDGAHPIGPQPQFLALAPWAVADGPRDTLRAAAARLAPGSGDPMENDYLETGLVADLPFPAVAGRRGCVTRPAPAARSARAGG